MLSFHEGQEIPVVYHPDYPNMAVCTYSLDYMAIKYLQENSRETLPKVRNVWDLKLYLIENEKQLFEYNKG